MNSCKKILLIGWDGADWKVINPLLDAGKMPNLAKIVNEGVMGNLATLYPSFSPMLWTSIATGQRPFRHGVCGFMEPDLNQGGVRPIMSLSRKTKAIWNILCQNEKRCNVIGWWPSHPAEPINGVMVSNHYHKHIGPHDKPWPIKPGTIYPPRLTRNLAKLRLHPGNMTASSIQAFVPKAGEVDQEKDKRLWSVAKIASECSTVQNATLAVMHHEPWDFTAVYFDSIDHFSHGFMRYHPPRPKWVSKEDFDIYSPVVEKGYIYHDMMLGELMEEAGKETTVILISDHGFHPDELRPRRVPREPAGPAAQHRSYGIFAMKGPGIKKDERIYGASLLDVCPTILTLLDLPVGLDMDGKPLSTAFEKQPKIQTIPSWEDVPGDHCMHPPDLQIDPVDSQASINQLVELGYIEKPDENQDIAAKKTVRDLEYNKALSYMDANRHADAIRILEPLFNNWPGQYRFGTHLVHCWLSLDRPDKARPILTELKSRKQKNLKEARKKLKEEVKKNKTREPKDFSEKEKRELRDLKGEASVNPGAFTFLNGLILFAEGEHELALKEFRKTGKRNARQPGLHLKIGNIYLEMKRWDDAETCFHKALSIDSDDSAAHLGLAQTFLGSRRNILAAAEALKSVGLMHNNPTGHFVLGKALHRIGRIPRAVEALRVAVAQNPNYIDAYRRLAYISEHRLKNPVQAAKYKKQAKRARKRVRLLKTGQITDAPQPAASDAPETVKTDSPDQSPGEVDISKTVVVVSGLPRSGTSMIMQMLEAGGIPAFSDEERKADADNPRGYYEHEKVRSLGRDNSWLEKAIGKSIKIIAHLLRFLPARLNYRVIFIERALDEVVESQRIMLEHMGKKGANISTDQLKETFSKQISQAGRMLARRNVPTLYLKHRDCIKNPGETADRLNKFLGEGHDTKSMIAAIDPLLHRQKGK